MSENLAVVAFVVTLVLGVCLLACAFSLHIESKGLAREAIRMIDWKSSSAPGARESLTRRAP